jgi:hypothetical protein
MMQKFLLNDLSKDILAGKISAENPIIVDVADGNLTFLEKNLSYANK